MRVARGRPTGYICSTARTTTDATGAGGSNGTSEGRVVFTAVALLVKYSSWVRGQIGPTLLDQSIKIEPIDLQHAWSRAQVKCHWSKFHSPINQDTSRTRVCIYTAWSLISHPSGRTRHPPQRRPREGHPTPGSVNGQVSSAGRRGDTAHARRPPATHRLWGAGRRSGGPEAGGGEGKGPEEAWPPPHAAASQARSCRTLAGGPKPRGGAIVGEGRSVWQLLSFGFLLPRAARRFQPIGRGAWGRCGGGGRRGRGGCPCKGGGVGGRVALRRGELPRRRARALSGMLRVAARGGQ